MSRPLPVFGLVGGIGAGKSHVSAAFAKLGATVFAGDPLGHAALKVPDLRDRVVERWSRDVLGPDGEIHRPALATRVFADEAERKALEAITLPWIGKRLREGLRDAANNPAVPLAVLDAAIMLEAGWNGDCTLLVYIHAPRTVRLERVARQRGWTPADVAARERAQLSLTIKARRADAALDNGGRLALDPQVAALYAAWARPVCAPEDARGPQYERD